MSEIISIKNITQAHELMGLEKPSHPLISVFKHCPEMRTDYGDIRLTSDLYFISMKDGVSGTFGYGRNSYDFEEGVMIFMAPNQVITPGDMDIEADAQGWTILFHPDLIRSLELGRTIEDYSFFDYEVTEALHLSEKEKKNLTELVQKIETEITQNMDQHSQRLIVSNLELLLNYCTRYYDRQFYTRSNHHSDVIVRFEDFLKGYFKAEEQLENGIPTVGHCAEQLSMSANYLSDLLKKETGRNAQDHIHSFIINKAKTDLLNSKGPVSQVAYGLGFDYSQHFSRLFKAKTGMSPKEYRSLN